MAIIVSCQCGRQLKAKDEHAGMQATCPTCRKVILIPAAEPTVASSSSAPNDIPRVPDKLSFLREAPEQHTSANGITAHYKNEMKHVLGAEKKNTSPLVLIIIGVFGGLFVFFVWLFASSSQPKNDLAVVLSTLLFAIIPIFILAVIVLYIVMLVWVARDAKARGMDGGVWLFLVLFTGLIGLLIYVLSRPQGNLVPCAKCANKRLQASAVCPHCGNA
jgi:hypothetical protein